MRPPERLQLPFIFWTALGAATGFAIFVWVYPTEWFSWPGPGDKSSTTIVLSGVLMATNSLLIFLLLTRKFLGQHSQPLAAGILVFSLVLAGGPVAVILRNPSPLNFGPLKTQTFYVHEGQGFGGGSVRDEVTIYAREPVLSFEIVNVWSGKKYFAESIAIGERSISACDPMTFCDYRFEHVVEIDGQGAYEIFDTSEPRRGDFFVVRENRAYDSCDKGIVYPNYTWLAYNAAGYENLYTVLPGTWIDHRDPIAGNRTDFHTHDVTTKIAKTILRQESCLTPLTNTDIDQTTDWQNLELIVLSGHDEFWTKEMLSRIRAFVEKGGKLAIFGGNMAYKEIQFDKELVRFSSKKWGETKTPEESVLGSAFRFAGYDLSDSFTVDEAVSLGLEAHQYRDSSGIYVARPEHPIFSGTGLGMNHLFGKSSRVHVQEMDGVPLKTTEWEIDASRYSGPVEIDGVLAYGFATYAGSINKHGAIVEFEIGAGKVLNAGMINWGNATDRDSIVEKITLNIINYLDEFS